MSIQNLVNNAAAKKVVNNIARAAEEEQRVADAAVAAKAEKAKTETVEAERRIEANRVEAERVEAERVEAERVEAEKVAESAAVAVAATATQPNTQPPVTLLNNVDSTEQIIEEPAQPINQSIYHYASTRIVDRTIVPSTIQVRLYTTLEEAMRHAREIAEDEKMEDEYLFGMVYKQGSMDGTIQKQGLTYETQVYDSARDFITAHTEVMPSTLAAASSSMGPTPSDSPINPTKNMTRAYSAYYSNTLLDTLYKLDGINTNNNTTQLNKEERIHRLMIINWEDIMKNIKLSYHTASTEFDTIVDSTTITIKNDTEVINKIKVFIAWFLTYRETSDVLDTNVLQHIRTFDYKTQQNIDIQRDPVSVDDKLTLHIIQIKSCAFVIILFMHILNKELSATYNTLLSLQKSNSSLYESIDKINTLWKNLYHISQSLLNAINKNYHSIDKPSNMNDLFNIITTLVKNSKESKDAIIEINDNYTVTFIQRISNKVGTSLYKNTKNYMETSVTLLNKLYEFILDLNRILTKYNNLLQYYKRI